MDLHRINGQLWEIKANYLNAIDEYKKSHRCYAEFNFFIYLYRA